MAADGKLLARDVLPALTAQMEKTFSEGDGIVSCDVEQTIRNLGDVGGKGMRETDVEIIKAMSKPCDKQE